MNASGVQLAMLAWDLNCVMDTEVYATDIQVIVENTGINVALGEVMQEKIITNSGNVYIYTGEGGRGTRKETEEIMSNFTDILGRLNELKFIFPYDVLFSAWYITDT